MAPAFCTVSCLQVSQGQRQLYIAGCVMLVSCAHCTPPPAMTTKLWVQAGPGITAMRQLQGNFTHLPAE